MPRGQMLDFLQLLKQGLPRDDAWLQLVNQSAKGPQDLNGLRVNVKTGSYPEARGQTLPHVSVLVICWMVMVGNVCLCFSKQLKLMI